MASAMCFLPDDRRDQRLPGRLVERRGRRREQHAEHHLPRLDDARERDHGQPERDEQRDGLRPLQQPAPVVAVGQRPAQRAEQDQRDRLAGPDEAGPGDRVGQRVDVVQVRGDRAAGADLAEDDPGPVEIEVAVAQDLRQRHQSTGTRLIFAGSMCRYTWVPGSIEISGLVRARISCLPTATTWSTASPRNARVTTVPVQTFGTPVGALGAELHGLRPDGHDDVVPGGQLVLRLDEDRAVRGLHVVLRPLRLADGPGDEVRGADELRHELVGRLHVDLAGLAELDHRAGLHDGDVRGQRERLDLVVGDVDRGDAELALQPLELVPQVLAQLGVEVGQRLVEQQQRRLDDQRAGQREALLLAAGELGGLPVDLGGELHGLQHALDALPDLLLRRPVGALADLQREGDVVEHGHVRPDRVGLEHHAQAALVGRHVHVPAVARGEQDAVTDGDAAAVRLLQAGDGAQRRGLAAARGAEQGEQLALLDLEADVVDGEHRGRPLALLRLVAGEGLHEVVDGEHEEVLGSFPTVTRETSAEGGQRVAQSSRRPTLAPSL